MRPRSWWPLLALVSISACTTEPEMPEPGLRGAHIDAPCPRTESATGYYPPGIFEAPVFTTINGSGRADFAALLTKMGEPSLFCLAAGYESYRVLWMPHAGTPLAVRVDQTDQGADVVMARLQPPTWNFPPGEVVASRQLRLSRADWQRILAAVADAGFWRMDSTNRTTMHDGNHLVIEGRRGTSYHAVKRHAPPPSEPASPAPRTASGHGTLALLLLRVAGVNEQAVAPVATDVPLRPDRPQLPIPDPPKPRSR